MDRYGYWNKLLHVNLTERRTWIEEPGDVFFRRYGGGRGIIAHYLLKHVPKGADPLGPENLLIFAPGVLTGAPVPGAGRHSVGAKSPLTGGFGESEAGGFWGAELKRARSGWIGVAGGTGAAMQGKSLEGGMPTLNYRLGSFEKTAQVDAIAVRDQMRVKMEACYACSVRCKKVVHIEKKEEAAREAQEKIYGGKGKVGFDPLGRYAVDPRYGGPEDESLAAMGVNLGLDDIVAITKSNEMCNYLAMDTVSLGSTLAWAMECFEKGILTLEDTEGIPLNFHDADGVIKVVELIAYRQGIGDLLAEGSLRAAQRLGRGSEAFLTTVKGMEMAMHDPRHMPVMRASYLLAPTGGDHMRQTSNRNGLRNQIGLCHFLAYEDDQSLQIIKTVTGWDITPEEMVTTAHRGLTLARLFNLREGMSRADDRLPARFSDPLPKHAGLTREQQDKIVTDYYVEQGWDPATGVPTRETIRVLDLEADAVHAG